MIVVVRWDIILIAISLISCLTFVLSFVPRAKPTTALFIDSPGRTGGQKPGFFAERRVTDPRTGQKTRL